MTSKTVIRQFEDNKVLVDLSGWETISVQVIGGSGTISLLASNNPGDITGSTDGNAKDATDFTAVQAINLTTGAAATVVTGTNVFRINPIGFRFLQIGDGSTAAGTKVCLFLSRPN